MPSESRVGPERGTALNDQLGRVHRAAGRLSHWLALNGWEGIDHYDIMDHPVLRPLVRSRSGFYLLTLLLDSIPGVLARTLSTRRKINAKGMALLLSSCVDLFELSRDARYVDEARRIAAWLLKNPSPGYDHLCWGYPFNWQSDQFLEAGTPSGVVTAHVVHALLDLHRVTGDRDALRACESAARFFVSSLHRSRMGPDEVCFSYTPRDVETVYNASLLVADALIATNAAMPLDIDMNDAHRAVTFVLRHQNADGSWDYTYPAGRIDPYHTGFVLRSLYGIHRLAARPDIPDALHRGLTFFRASLFGPDMAPYYRKGRKYPIDIHSCAEGILSFAEFSDLRPEYLEDSLSVAGWTIENMQSPEGYFYYRKYPFHRVKIAYLRWGQAWMIRALSRLLLKCSQRTGVSLPSLRAEST